MATLAALESTFHELNATRYMSAVGLMVLLYDHVLTFADEVDYVWSAPGTYAKYVFLLNRYTVLATLLAVAYEMCGFVGSAFTDTGCKQFIFICSMVAIISVGIANLLTLQRVVILWDHRPAILKVMAAGFIISFTAQVTSMIFTLINTLSYISWNSTAGMCIATRSSPILIAVWACPMIFELFVLGSTALNALDRPRGIELPIRKALHEDGIQFFVCIAVFRVINIAFAALGRPSLTFLAVFFIWAMTTTVLSRLLLHLRRSECCPPPVLDPRSDEFDPSLAAEAEAAERPSRTLSPFGLVPLTRHMTAASASASAHSHRTEPGWGKSTGTSREGCGYGDEDEDEDGDDCDEVVRIAPSGRLEYYYARRSQDPS